MGILYILNCTKDLLTRNYGFRLSLTNNIILIDVDRSALAAAKVYGIMDDLHMTTNDFATAISILFGKTIFNVVRLDNSLT